MQNKSFYGGPGGGFFKKSPLVAEGVFLVKTQKGSDYPMRPYFFSDGTLRFICLATALLQPDPPATMIIDEPELGLHPYAVDILAELMETASNRSQLIVSTQSPALVDCFKPESIVVVSREQGASVLRRLNAAELTHWLEDNFVSKGFQRGEVEA